MKVFKHWRHYLESSAHPVEVLTDHNNLQGFMKVKALNVTASYITLRAGLEPELLMSYINLEKYKEGKPVQRAQLQHEYQGCQDTLVPI